MGSDGESDGAAETRHGVGNAGDKEVRILRRFHYRRIVAGVVKAVKGLVGEAAPS